MKGWNPIRKLSAIKGNHRKGADKVEDATDSITISCGNIFDISVVGQKYSEFKEALGGENTIYLSANELQKIDGAGIQMLVAFFNEAKKMQIDIKWSDTSESLLNSAEILGVKSELHLDNQTA